MGWARREGAMAPTVILRAASRPQPHHPQHQLEARAPIVDPVDRPRLAGRRVAQSR